MNTYSKVAKGVLTPVQFTLFHKSQPSPGPCRVAYWERVVDTAEVYVHALENESFAGEYFMLAESFVAVDSLTVVQLVANHLASTSTLEVGLCVDQVDWAQKVIADARVEGALDCWMKDDLTSLFEALCTEAEGFDAHHVA